MLQNAWTEYGGTFAPAGYFKDSQGVVHLRGLVVNAAISTACVFTLPPGYRPGFRGIYPARYYSTGVGEGGIRVDIQTNGCVNAPSVTTAVSWLSFESISFLAE